MSEAPGKSLLRFSGILFIIFGLLSALFSILAFAGLGTWADMLGVVNNTTNRTGIGSTTGSGIGSTTGSVAGGIMTGALIMIMVMALFEIITGIVGWANSEKPHNANVCIALAVVMILLQIATGIVGRFSWMSMIGLLLPILYLIGAIQNHSVASHQSRHYSGAH